MVSGFDHGLRQARAKAFTAAGILFFSGLLASCSSVPDAVNPVEWYKSATGESSEQDIASAPSEANGKAVAADTRKGLSKSLPGDGANAKYAEPVRREVAPTKPLARRPAPVVESPPQAAQAPVAPAAVPPKPVVIAQNLPPAPAPVAAPAASAPVAVAPPAALAPAAASQSAALAPVRTQVPAPAAAKAPVLSPDQRTAAARDDGPQAPPASMNMAPPPPAAIPETVATQPRGPRRLQEQFERRLAESASQTVKPGVVATSQSPSYGAREEDPIHLVPPSSQRAHKGGGKGMAAPEPDAPAASFQVASVDFHAGSSELTSADRASIAEVARLYKQTGGVVRIVGYAPAPLVLGGDDVGRMMGGLDASMKRANAVAGELAKRGVPARKILVGANPAAGGNTGAQVYIDVM